jgi:hypothetical protein
MKTIGCTISRIVVALYFTEDSPYLYVPRHSVTVNISQYNCLLSNASLRSVTL